MCSTMTTDRVYQKARSHEEVMELILSGKCGAFNPILLKCLEAVADQIQESQVIFLLRSRKKTVILVDKRAGPDLPAIPAGAVRQY